MQKQLARNTNWHLLHTHLVSKAYQVCNDIVALFLQPHKNTRCVQTATVCQNHSTLRHDKGCFVQQAVEQQQRQDSRE